MLDSNSMHGNSSHHQDSLQETLSVAQFFKELRTQNSMRVKVYCQNSEGKWDDQGTGHVTVHYIERSEELGLFVYDEEDSETILLHRICSEVVYRKQKDTIISWRDHEYSTEIALSFQEHKGCSYIWDQICRKQRSQQFNSLQINEPFEESPATDVGFALNTKSQSFNIGTKKSLYSNEIINIEEDRVLLDHSHQVLIVADPIQNKGLNVGAEEGNSTINAIAETCLEETSVEENKPENEITFEILSEHFGKSLDDAANSFCVSRSTFKRICRSHGIKRWQCGKGRMGVQSSSKLRKVNDKEPSKMNDVYSSISPLQDIAGVGYMCQDMNKINVKATYNGVAIRFELLNSSGMAELEDNVIERLKLQRDAFSIKYKDEEGDWVLIACDKDVQKCIEISRSMRKTIIKMLVDLPISR